MSNLDDLLNQYPSMEDVGGHILSPEETAQRYKEDSARTFEDKQRTLDYLQGDSVPLPKGKYVAVLIDMDGNEDRIITMNTPTQVVVIPGAMPQLTRYEGNTKYVTIPRILYSYDGRVTKRYQKKTGKKHYVYIKEND